MSLCRNNQELEATVISVTANFKSFRQLELVFFPCGKIQNHSDLKNFSSDCMKGWDLVSPVFTNCLLISLLPVVQKQALFSSSPFHNKDISVIFLNIQKQSSFSECSRALPKLLLPNQQLLVSAGSEGKKGLGWVMQRPCGGSGVCEGRQILY